MKKLLLPVFLVLVLASCQKKANTRCYVCTSVTTTQVDGGAVAGYTTTERQTFSWCDGQSGDMTVEQYEKFNSYKTSKKERVTSCN